MDPYTKDTLPAAGGYSPTPAPPAEAQIRRRKNLSTLLHSDRRIRYFAGAALVVAGAVAVPTVSHLLTKPAPQVLEAARTLPAGHVIAQGDLTAVTGQPQGASLVPAGQATSMLGQQVKLEVPAGALVAPGDFGTFPPTGMSIVPVAVKPGQYPPDLRGGDQVAIFPTAGTSGSTAQPAAHAVAIARVIQLQSTNDANGTTVVLLETPIAQAPVIAQAPGVVLVVLDSNGDAP